MGWLGYLVGCDKHIEHAAAKATSLRIARMEQSSGGRRYVTGPIYCCAHIGKTWYICSLTEANSLTGRIQRHGGGAGQGVVDFNFMHQPHGVLVGADVRFVIMEQVVSEAWIIKVQPPVSSHA